MNTINKNSKTTSSKTAKNEDYLLSNSENYKESITESTDTIAMQYFQLLCDYLNVVLVKKNTTNVIISGFETITHVFLLLLYYTNNLGLSIYYSEKAYCLYNEYIDQLFQEENNKFFFKMKSYDAILFVYKNTIYNINKKHKSCTKETVEKKRNTIFLELDKKIASYKKGLTKYLIMNTNEKEYSLTSAIKSMIN